MYRTLQYILVVVIVVETAYSQVDASHCAALKEKPRQPSDILPMMKISDECKAIIGKQWACLLGYTAGYDGGEDAFLHASASQLRNDLMHLKTLFDNPLLIRVTGENLSSGDRVRIQQIQKGWVREQVLLWGNFAYMQRLHKEKRFSIVLAEANRIRGELGMTVVPLEHWDGLQNATYFAPQTLRNMIAAIEYEAKGHLVARSGEARATLVKAYLSDEPALTPTMSFTGNPGESVLGPLCN